MNKRAEKFQEQLQKNAQAVDAINAAEALLGKVQANIAERQAALADARAEVQRTALDMADGREVDGPAALSKVDAAPAALSLAEAALPAAQARLEQARIDARKNRLAADVALVNKFGRRRIEAANSITAAIEALGAAFVAFHEASRSLAASLGD